MTLKDARALRREIIDTANYHCVVPLGHGPTGYFARIFSSHPVDFHSRAEFRKYRADSLRAKRRSARSMNLPAPHHPIELMIDRACGLA